MEVLRVHPEVLAYLQKHNLKRAFAKQIKLLKHNPRHPGLAVELLEPRHLRFFSFRIDRKYRAFFIFRDSSIIEVIDVNNHYQ